MNEEQKQAIEFIKKNLSNEEFNQKLDLLYKEAQESFLEKGNLRPILTMGIWGNNGVEGLSYRIISDFDISDDKYQDMFNLGKKMKQELADSGGGGIYSAYLATEAWYVERSEQDIKNVSRPSQEKDKKSALSIAGLTADGRVNSLMFPLRMEDGKVIEIEKGYPNYYKEGDKVFIPEMLKAFFKGYAQAQVSRGFKQKGVACHGYGINILDEQKIFMSKASDDYFIQFLIITKTNSINYQLVLHDFKGDRESLSPYSYYCSKVLKDQDLKRVIKKELEKIFSNSVYINYLILKFQKIDQAKNKQGKLLDRYLVALEIDSDDSKLDRKIDHWYFSWAKEEELKKMTK